MSIALQDAIVSGPADPGDAPLGEETSIGPAEYERIMRRVLGDGDGTDTRVCAFNSSI